MPPRWPRELHHNRYLTFELLPRQNTSTLETVAWSVQHTRILETRTAIKSEDLSSSVRLIYSLPIDTEGKSDSSRPILIESESSSSFKNSNRSGLMLDYENPFKKSLRGGPATSVSEAYTPQVNNSTSKNLLQTLRVSKEEKPKGTKSRPRVLSRQLAD
jgi:hypothetical protein